MVALHFLLVVACFLSRGVQALHPTSLRVDENRFTARLDYFRQVGSRAFGGVGRLALSSLEVKARRTLMQIIQVKEAPGHPRLGLDCTQDDVANLYCRLEPDTMPAKAAEPVWCGGHLDTPTEGTRCEGGVQGSRCFRAADRSAW
eukprot:scaffold1233_cov395-Prasinococcus_capsulatus_cf.AAC.9